MTFRAQLILFMALPVILLAALMGWLATRTASDTVRRDAVRVVGVVANSREQELISRLSSQSARANNLLRLQADECLPAPDRAGCIKDILNAFRAAESAKGISLTTPDGTFTSGAFADHPLAHKPLKKGQAARLGPREGSDRWYVVKAQGKEAAVTVQYPTEALASIFADRFGLGRSGETFLADDEGFFVTRGRYPSDQGHSHPNETAPMRDCLEGKDTEVLQADYRNVPVIHGFRHVQALGGACIMAHIAQAEAFAPIGDLQRRLLSLSLAGLIASSLLALALARHLTGPLLRLSRRAMEIQDGHLKEPIPREGPKEVRQFADAFAGMVATLALEQEQLKKAIGDLKTAEGRKDDFVRMAGHELKTPVTSLFIYTQSLQRRLHRESHPDAKKADNIAAQLENLSRLIGALLDIARLDARRLQLTRAEVNLTSLVHDTARIIERSAGSHRIHVKGEIDAPVCGDETRLRQVLTNILTNAVKYSPQASRVDVRLRTEGANAVISVRDYGVGIPESELPRIFERYRRVHGTDETTFSGLGVGLYISQQIVKLHEGTLTAVSDGRGSTFRLMLPISR